MERLESKGRLMARPQTGTRTFQAPLPGLYRLSRGELRDGLIFIPSRFERGRSIATLLMLHGAGGFAAQALVPFQDLAERTGTILVAPESRGRTWDVVLGGFGEDVAFIDGVLEDVFSRYPVDHQRLAIAGFSDGASYALSLGITNGDLFSHIMALSPGFLAPSLARGTPEIFISHGDEDPILDIDHCSRRIVPLLRKVELKVTYTEFHGGHTIPAAIGKAAFSWFCGPGMKGAISHASVPMEESGAEAT